MNQRLLIGALCAASLGVQMWGAETPAATPANTNTAAPAAAATTDDLQQLKARIAEQQEQIKKLQIAVEEQQKMLERSLEEASRKTAAATTTADGTAVLPASTSDTVKIVPAVNLKPDILKMPRGMQKEVLAASPLALTIGNATFTPLGFVDAAFFARSTNVGSGLGTNFAGVPFNNAATDHLSETGFSAQNSRIGFRVDSTFMGAKVLGYWESDFIFNNNANSYQITSNSAGFRMRVYFADVQKGPFEFLGGQDWSLLTPNRKGLGPTTPDYFYTQNEDVNYQAGLVWARQPQFRFVAHASKDFAIGLSVENPQQYIGGGSGASTVTLPSNVSAALGTQFQSNSSITGVPNWFPDIVAKAAYDGHAGDKLMHIEAAGLISGFKDYVLSTTAPAIHGSHTAAGFGGSVNANLEVVKNVRLIMNTFFSDGGGRYIFGIAPDVIVRPDGSIAALHSYSTVDGFEAQVSKKVLLAAYYGAAAVGRSYVADPTSTAARPVYAGYGFPGASVNRNVQEFTFDWIQTFWKNPSYGALALINQYSYLLRDPWYVAPGTPKSAHTNMFYVSFRYTLP